MTYFSLFDLDNTLLLGDSDHAWGEYLADQNIVDGTEFRKKNEYYYQSYVAGTLNIHEYCAFALQPLVEHPLEKMLALRKTFVQEIIKPMITNQARELVQESQAKGHTCIIITATNSFVTRPIADLFMIEHLIATEPEISNGLFTGKINGTPCFQAGKLVCFDNWLQKHNLTKNDITHLTAFSDSYNDLPLLEMANKPVVVNPDDKLKLHAQQQKWPILHFTHQACK